MEKCLILYSNGLDSRLVVKIMQEKGFEPIAIYFKLPFSPNLEKESKEFCEKNKCKFILADCTKSPLLEEYLHLIDHPKFNRGTSFNPCIDCKAFLLKKAKEFADKNKINLIVTGEVLGERPMSQTLNAMRTIEKEAGVVGRIFRPLSAKLLPEIEGTNKNEFYEISGRSRKTQMELAEHFKIDYPTPGGGCKLCEPQLKARLKLTIKNNMLNQDNYLMAQIGKHYVIDKNWFVVARNEKESLIIEKMKNSIESDLGVPAIYFYNKDTKEKALEIQKAYKEKNSDLYKEFKI